MPFIPFEEVEQLADIEQLANRLDLKLNRSKTQLRGVCPVHGGDERTLCISPGVRSRKGSLGVFFCQKDATGGDRIGLVAHCLELGQHEAAMFINDQFGSGSVDTGTSSTSSTVSKSRATVPQKPEGGSQPAPFDPAAFAAKLKFSDEVAALGFSEADAAQLGIGFCAQGSMRGRVCFPLRNADGSISGFVGYAEGAEPVFKLPPRWIASNVVQLKRPA